MSPLLCRYLFFYNSFQALGWAISLYRIWSNLISSRSVSGAYSSAGELICFLQSLAFLEVIHGAIGIVPSGVLFPLMQWGGRTHFLLTIVRGIHEVQELPSVFITFLAWSLSEVIRYLHYAINCIGSPPHWITCLRYTAFIVLYPIGVGPGEIWLMYQALPFIKEQNLHADLFSALPFNYYRFIVVYMHKQFNGFTRLPALCNPYYDDVRTSLIILLIFYPFLWLKLYLHLFKQRSSKLGKQKKKKN